MPANKKYLTHSVFKRWLKITAGFFGGYGVMISFFLMLTYFLDRQDVLMTGALAGCILWAILLLFAFLSKSGWKIWLIYIALILIFSLPYFLNFERI